MEYKKKLENLQPQIIADVTDANGVYIDGNVIEILRNFRS